MRAATEGSLPPVTPQGNLVEVLGREVRQGSPGELMVESSPSRQRRPPCKTNKEMSDEAADAAALTYLLLTYTPQSFLEWCIKPKNIRKGIMHPISNVLDTIMHMVTMLKNRHPWSLASWNVWTLSSKFSKYHWE